MVDCASLRERDFGQTGAAARFGVMVHRGGLVIMWCAKIAAVIVATALPLSARADTPYFPFGVWGPTYGGWTEVEQAVFLENWFGGQLAAMQEKPLAGDTPPDDADMVVRLLFLPTFDHGTMLRVVIDDAGQMNYVFKELDGAGGYEPGQLRRRMTGDVEDTVAGNIKIQIDTIGASQGNMPSQVFDPGLICSDGTTVVLEFATGDTHRALTRHDCQMDITDPIRLLVNALDDASGGRVIAPEVGWRRE
jgi:hypothetical protein